MTRPSDDFTRNLIAWQNQVVADRELTLLAFHVAYVIGQHVNRGTGDAWPSQGRLCEALSASRRGVQMAIDQLASRGHLGVTVQRGRNGSNKYRPLLKQAVIEPGSGDLNAHGGAHLTGDNAHGGAHLEGQGAHEDAHLNDDNAHDGAHQMRTGVRTNHLNEQSEGYTLSPSISNFEIGPQVEADPAGQQPTALAAKVTRAQAASQFDEWWNVYPRKVGKEAARPVFARILKAGQASLAELAAGAERYAAERAGEDPTFTKHPKTWLNGGHWNDEPAPRATAQRRTGQGYSALNRLMEDGGHGE